MHSPSMCIHSYASMEFILCIHAIGVPEGVTLLELEGAHQEEEQEQSEEPEVPTSEERAIEELPECPDHRPSSFLKGKTRCMLTQHLYTYHLSTFTCLLH
jgi:hypothetical protein